jgi:ribonuclease Y
MEITLFWIIAAAVAGLGAGSVGGNIVRKKLISERQRKLEVKQKEIILKAKGEALKIREKAKEDEERRRLSLESIENKLRERELTIDRRLDHIERQRKEIENKRIEISRIRREIEGIRNRQLEALEKVAGLSKEEAKTRLFAKVEKEYSQDIIKKVKEYRETLKESSEKEARKILSIALERIAGEFTAEHTSYTVNLPNEEMKGRIIGKEGRNVQTFEKLTGVDVVIDDTPDAVLVSSFDPIRRHIGKLTLEKLVEDGRIQPTRIEEVFKKVTKNIGKEIKEAGEQAAYEVGVPGLSTDLLKLLGRLKFRTSYGQNQLSHSLEVANIAGILAQELGADVNIAKKAGLLHDIGKAVDHEIEGAHHHISMDIARKYGLSETVINAIGAHHDYLEPMTVQPVLVKPADAISGSRSGARRESVEQYMKRLIELENVANSFKGVEKSYAIQAGREVRILVKPEDIDDLEALKLAKDIARKIEEDMQYPGQIKVNVIRETRAVEYAK